MIYRLVNNKKEIMIINNGNDKEVGKHSTEDITDAEKDKKQKDNLLSGLLPFAGKIKENRFIIAILVFLSIIIAGIIYKKRIIKNNK